MAEEVAEDEVADARLLRGLRGDRGHRHRVPRREAHARPFGALGDEVVGEVDAVEAEAFHLLADVAQAGDLDVADLDPESHGGSSFQVRSTIIAMASPPPRQSAAQPRRRFRCRRAESSVTRTRAPLAPIGWPSAMAPP